MKTFLHQLALLLNFKSTSTATSTATATTISPSNTALFVKQIRGGGAKEESDSLPSRHSTTTPVTTTDTPSYDHKSPMSNNNNININAMEEFEQLQHVLLQNITATATATAPTTTLKSSQPLNFVFSDVDGTLVHYPPSSHQQQQQQQQQQQHMNTNTENKIIQLPPSSTGMVGIISFKTIQYIQLLRHSKQHNTKFILVSGMRTSTLLKRLPYLPKADAYVSEAGGRIFYPIDNHDDNDDNHDNHDNDDDNQKWNMYNGQKVKLIHENEEFGLEEDLEWRNGLSHRDAAGLDGYRGDAMNTFLHKQPQQPQQQQDQKNHEEEEMIPIHLRQGALWEFAKTLQQEGFTLDYKGYTCCFRVNRKQQQQKNGVISDDDFDRLAFRNVSELGLASSVNLGCIDFYPICSGKKNSCAYLAKKFMSTSQHDDGGGGGGGIDDEMMILSSMNSGSSGSDDIISNDSTRTRTSASILLKRAICLCDDDNDLEMASACGQVFLPSISSTTMAEAAKKYPEKIFVAERKESDIVETKATEYALLKAMALLNERSQLGP